MAGVPARCFLSSQTAMTHDLSSCRRSPRGTLDPSELRATSSPLLEHLLQQRSPRSWYSNVSKQKLRHWSWLGKPRPKRGCSNGLRPIIDRAIERAEGNERLQADYRRVLPEAAPTLAATQEQQVEVEVPKSLIAELGRLNATLDQTQGDPRIDFQAPSDRPANVRYLAVLDQRLSKATPASREPLADVLDAYVLALGSNGDAVAVVTDLFERGPLMRPALNLAATTREALVRAALANGLQVTSNWLGDERLGAWLSGIVGNEAAPPAGDQPTHRSSCWQAPSAQRQLLGPRICASSGSSLMPSEHSPSGPCRPLPTSNGPSTDSCSSGSALSHLGVSQVAPLGAQLTNEEVDATRHEIISPTPAARYIVRSAGLMVDGDVLVKARLEVDEG